MLCCQTFICCLARQHGCQAPAGCGCCECSSCRWNWQGRGFKAIAAVVCWCVRSGVSLLLVGLRERGLLYEWL